MRSSAISIAVIGGVLCAGCESIDDFGFFHVVGDGGGQHDAAVSDLAGVADLSASVDMEAAPDLTTPLDMTTPCITTLANVGAGDFGIRFQITTNAAVQSTILYQRSACDAANSMWDITLLKNGPIVVVVGQGGGNWTAFNTTIPVNDGKPHDIVMQRRAGVMTTTTDGAASGGGAAPQALGVLPPLGIGKGNSCEQSGLTPLVGTVTNICLSGTALPVPPSCVGLPNTCGANSNGDCCESPWVTGGPYNRSNDPKYPAMVATFRLDKYEITVGRFRKFVDAGYGTQAKPPTAGDGAHPKIMGSGWDMKWNAGLVMDTATLKATLKCDQPNSWTDDKSGNENLPINCISWYEEFAFCAWDGGRLPTEAEWNYAAAGGSEQRPYPWSANMNDMTMDPSYAVYGSAIGSVGSKSPKGDGKWGQADLAGNIEELVLDWYVNPYVNPCNDCADLSPGTNRVYRGGNWRDAGAARSSDRGAGVPSARASIFGARCARTP